MVKDPVYGMVVFEDKAKIIYQGKQVHLTQWRTYYD